MYERCCYERVYSVTTSQSIHTYWITTCTGNPIIPVSPYYRSLYSVSRCVYIFLGSVTVIKVTCIWPHPPPYLPVQVTCQSSPWLPCAIQVRIYCPCIAILPPKSWYCHMVFWRLVVTVSQPVHVPQCPPVPGVAPQPLMSCVNRAPVTLFIPDYNTNTPPHHWAYPYYTLQTRISRSIDNPWLIHAPVS